MTHVTHSDLLTHLTRDPLTHCHLWLPVVSAVSTRCPTAVSLLFVVDHELCGLGLAKMVLLSARFHYTDPTRPDKVGGLVGDPGRSRRLGRPGGIRTVRRCREVNAKSPRGARSAANCGVMGGRVAGDAVASRVDRFAMTSARRDTVVPRLDLLFKTIRYWRGGRSDIDYGGKNEI